MDGQVQAVMTAGRSIDLNPRGANVPMRVAALDASGVNMGEYDSPGW